MNKFPDSFVLSVIKSIKKRCFMKGLMIPSDRFVLKLLKLFFFSPAVSNNQEDLKKSAETLIELVVDILKVPNNPSVATLNLQIYFHENYTDRDYVLAKRYECVEKSARPLLNLINQKRKQNVKGKQDLDQLYHYISCYIILISGLTNPTDNDKLKEITALLKSVLTSNELARFISKSASLKEKQLQDICRIVTGIKIFNNHGSGKKLEEANEQLSVIGNAVKYCYNFITQMLREVDDCSSSLICHYRKFYLNDDFQSMMNASTCMGNSYYLKSCLIFLQQMNSYLKILAKESNILIDEYQSHLTQLHQQLSRVHRTVKFRTAVPVVEIYPQFRDISSSWNKIQDFITLANYLLDVTTNLKKSLEKVLESKYNNFQIDLSSCITQRRENDLHKLVFNNDQIVCEYISPKVDNELQEFQYNGFCCVTFIDSNGLLVSGIREYGFIKYEGSLFCFSSTQALQKFSQEPDLYVKKIEDTVFSWPETIELLKIEKMLEHSKVRSGSNNDEKKNVKTVEVQTETHPLASNINYVYESSIWKMKSHMCRKVNLQNYRTHSAQTDVSSFRKDAAT